MQVFKSHWLTVLLMTGSMSFAAANATPAFRPPDEETRQALTPLQVQTQAEAISAFRSQHYAAAFGRFAELADAGHAPSAELALVMLRHGAVLFGSDWTASATQRARWQVLVINRARSHVLTFDGGNSD